MPRQDLESRVRAKVAAIESRDPELRDELESVRNHPEMQEEARTVTEGFVPGSAALESAQSGLALETIVLRVGRPVLQVLRDQAQLVFSDTESEVWRARLANAQQPLVAAARATGRIEVEGHPRVEWLGTGFLVAPDVVVTNRHVAAEFGRRGGSRFVFRRTVDGSTMQADIDFLEEFGRAESLAFRIREILHIAEDDGPDMAFLRVEASGGRSLAAPLSLAVRDAAEGEQVAVIGYPARDSRIPDQALMERIFGELYDKKRLAPGEITGLRDGLLLHDCTTLGGVSGSALCSLASGEVVGLHFAGRFLEANFAVPARVVAERLRVFEGAAPAGPRRTPRMESGPEPGTPPVSPARREQASSRDAGPVVRPPAPQPAADGAAPIASVTVPIHVTVTVGAPITSPAGGGPGAPPPPRPAALAAGGDDGADDEDSLTEGVPEDYTGRGGYDPRFLGEGNKVPLPVAGPGREGDVLRFDGQREHVLRYEHFSVVMSRSRRMCFFSAVNIDGKKTKRNVERVGWRTDPRIPARAQIKGECYGNPPKFSRGHMTRREDPVWGDTAELGNADSMHVTNAVPQMQPFNAGIWLDLEDYALDHARKDSMRISVFTGPFLLDDDPVRFGVKVPVRFWKVIAFIHDKTGKLTATGYTLSQKDFLREEEFVFGEHGMAQVPIAEIEAETGFSFGDLASLDPLNTATEAFPGDAGERAPLRDLSAIRFV
jgi:endonuclease G